MRKLGGKVLFSATDLVNFLGCRHCTWLDLKNLEQPLEKAVDDAGITTVRALAQVREGSSVRKLAEETLARLRAQALLQVQKRETGGDVYELLDTPLGRGFQRLPRPDDGDLFFDIEGDPLYPDGLEYLFGFYYFENGEPVFEPFWAHEHDRECTSFREVMDFITGKLERHPVRRGGASGLRAKIGGRRAGDP